MDRSLGTIVEEPGEQREAGGCGGFATADCLGARLVQAAQPSAGPHPAPGDRPSRATGPSATTAAVVAPQPKWVQPGPVSAPWLWLQPGQRPRAEPF